jgi:ribosomal protein S18 acetylase RimI-like enzyme
MQINQLDPTNRRDARRFVDLPFLLYRDNAQWVPPFVDEARAQLDPNRHPFYQHSQAAFFLATEGDQVLGRIAALDNRRHNELHGARTAFFYLFDAVDDPAVSRALFDAACDWARGRGLDRVWGPKGFLHSDGQGILVDGFEHRPAMGIPYNFAYYGPLLEDAGFEKSIDFVSYRMDRRYQFPERYLEVAARVKQRRGLQSTTFRTRAELRALIPQVTAIYNQSFVEVQGYTPVTDAEAQAIGQRILSVADPGLISILTKGDELVGFVLAYPDVSAAIQRCRGRMWPLGWAHLLREFQRTRWINFNGAAILPRYRGLGGNALLYVELYHILIKHAQYDFADLVQVQETNTRMIQELESLGLRPYKRHRIYQRALS